jgi:hypothetical protein
MPDTKPRRIDTSDLVSDDWPFVVGYLVSTIESQGQATREDAEKAIAKAIENRPES